MMLVNIWKLSFKKPKFCSVIPFQERENQSLIAKISSLQDEVFPHKLISCNSPVNSFCQSNCLGF